MKRPLRGLFLLLPAAAFLLSLGVSAWSFARHFEGGLTHEFCNYAEIGRNLNEGLGLRTRLIYPYTLAVLDRRGIPFNGLAPVLDRFPLQAVLSAGAQRLWGDDDGAVAALSSLLLGLVAAATALAGLALFGPWEAAVASLLVALNPSFQRAFVLWGQPDIGFCLLALALTVLLARPGPRPAWGWLGLGALAGLAWLQRSNALLWLPLFGLWTVKQGGRRALLLFAGGAAATALPAAAYNLRWYGALTPPTLAWNLAHHTVVDTPPWLHFRTFTAADTLSGHLPELARKFLRYLALHLRDLPTWWQMHLVFPAALAGAWLLRSEKGRERARAYAALTGLMLLLQVLAFSFLRFEALGPWVGGRYYLWLAPAAFLLAAHAAREAGRRAGLPAALPALFACANAAWFIHGLAGPQGAPAYPRGLYAAAWPELEAARRAAPEDGLVATNLPGQIAWYARRPALALPAEPADLLRVAAAHRIDAVLVSRLRLGELDTTPAWKPLAADSRALAAFAARGGWLVLEDFGTSVLLARPPGAPR
ncbi:MAG: hypothetical protein HY554_16650 [Elusimicrobia bacterium]|nr:hypothetical protein [Elusimicrobiota bacterium]